MNDRFRIDFIALVVDVFTFGIYSGYHNIRKMEDRTNSILNGGTSPSNFQYNHHYKKLRGTE
jgi:hypothetical protein